MTLPAFQLTEPLVLAMVSLLSTNLNTTIDQLNATVTDGYTVDHIQQFLDYLPTPANLAGGLPLIGVQDLGSNFENDIVSSTDANHTYAVCAVIQNTDQRSLAWQLRRTLQAISYTIQSDRKAGTSSGTGGILRSQGGAWSVNLLHTEPGPALADLDPNDPEAPPRSFLSYSALVMTSMRAEQIPGQ